MTDLEIMLLLIIQQIREVTDMQTLQVHFTYSQDGMRVEDFCVVESKTKRLSTANAGTTIWRLAKQLGLAPNKIELTHYYIM